MQKLDNVVMTEKMHAKSWSSLDEIVKKIPSAFTDSIVELVNEVEKPVSGNKYLNFF